MKGPKRLILAFFSIEKSRKFETDRNCRLSIDLAKFWPVRLFVVALSTATCRQMNGKSESRFLFGWMTANEPQHRLTSLLHDAHTVSMKWILKWSRSIAICSAIDRSDRFAATIDLPVNFLTSIESSAKS